MGNEDFFFRLRDVGGWEVVVGKYFGVGVVGVFGRDVEDVRVGYYDVVGGVFGIVIIVDGVDNYVVIVNVIIVIIVIVIVINIIINIVIVIIKRRH